ncbi:MAG: HDIG domain-containing protein [Oligoflexales bacterium]|nr:HDIG domain-containing protein [Oligoflexales bacterium]
MVALDLVLHSKAIFLDRERNFSKGEFIVVLLALSILFGVVFFIGIGFLFLYLARKDSLRQRDEVLREVERQREQIFKESELRTQEHILVLGEELETFLQQKQEDLQLEEKDIESLELFCTNEEQRVQKIEQTLTDKEKEISTLQNEIDSTQKKELALKLNLIRALEHHTEMQASSLRQNLTDNLVNESQLEWQRAFKFMQEELSSSSKKLARRVLDRVHARYAPRFVWPKATHFVEVQDNRIFDALNQEDSEIINSLREVSETKITPMPSEDGKGPQNIKVIGGFGIFREAARLALEEFVIASGQNKNLQILNSFHKHRVKLENEAEQLGKKAVRILKLDSIHPEIQKLIGALNWRTSYRQNQWYHTVEVAELAGILAHELGINPDDAKRVGLLHDIGKAIDYRIDGSHAVISGDYADRYGEKRLICDTVMSHHADLKLDTPLAYLLQVADTLSGARPGARVNLEEGYQIRLSAIYEAVNSFTGILDVAVMNGGREVHVKVNHNKVRDADVKGLAEAIARKIEIEVAYPGQIKVLVLRTFEASLVA